MMIDRPIVRQYATSGQAQRAVEALRRWGFESERITVVSTASLRPPVPGAGDSAERDAVVQRAIEAGAVPRADARRHAEAVQGGRTLVSVEAPFGTGGIAEELLDQCEPVAADFEATPVPLLPSDLAAPLSEMLGMPAITRRGRTASEALGIPTLTQRDHFTFGNPRVGDNAAPFSRLFGLPVTTRRGRTLGEALNLPEITRSGVFVFGSPSLAPDSPAPFSSMLGLPVLVRDHHPRLEGSIIRERHADQAPTRRESRDLHASATPERLPVGSRERENVF